MTEQRDNEADASMAYGFPRILNEKDVGLLDKQNDELLARLEREVLGWPRVFEKRDEDGVSGIGVTGYRYGDPETGGPQIGHVHVNGYADFRFPREVRDELIRSGRAIAHPAFPNIRMTVSYRIRGAEAIVGALPHELRAPERIRRAEIRAARGTDRTNGEAVTDGFHGRHPE